MNATAAADPAALEWWGRLERLAATPGSFAAVLRMNGELDVSSVLPVIGSPTLVLCRVGDVWIDHARYFARHIREATLVELDGFDHVPWAGDPEKAADAIEEFLTGRHPPPRADRALATVLFTDVAESTKKTASVGDRKWRDILDALDERTSREVAVRGGHVVKSTGDGHLATFPGPTTAIDCAKAIREVVRQLGIAVRSGLHSGEIEMRGADVSGIAVNIANRVSSHADPDEIVVSRTVTDLVAGSGLEFEDRGEHELKGVPGRWQLYAVKS